jgi:3-oxoacyl-[acyl-carrier-protein] synthase-3
MHAEPRVAHAGAGRSAIGISAIFSEVPEHRVENWPRAASLGICPDTLENRIGVRRIAVKAAHEQPSDLCVAAAEKLFDDGLAGPEEIQCVAVVTQNPDAGGIPHTSAIVHGKLGLPQSCAAFDIGLGCSGYVYGLSLLKAFMEGNGLRRGLLFTADPYSDIVDPADRRTALLFGDAATVTLLSDWPAWKIGRCDFGTCGERSATLALTAQRKLAMDGRAVLEFCGRQVPESIRRAIALNGLAEDQVDRYVLHQGSRIVVDTIASRLKAPRKAGFYCTDYGNTVSSSIPLVLAHHTGESERVLAVCGFGAGLSWASTVLSRNPDVQPAAPRS